MPHHATRPRTVCTGIGLAAIVGLCAPLTACDGRSLPDPHADRQAEVGRVAMLTSGSAFNISIGMTQAEADRILDAGGKFQIKYQECVTPDSLTPNSDIMVRGHVTNFDPPSSGCSSDDLIEMRRADTYMRLAGWEDLLLDVRDGRIIKIEWARMVGYPA